MAVYVQEDDEKSDKTVLTKGLDETSELTFEKFNDSSILLSHRPIIQRRLL